MEEQLIWSWVMDKTGHDKYWNQGNHERQSCIYLVDITEAGTPGRKNRMAKVIHMKDHGSLENVWIETSGKLELDLVLQVSRMGVILWH